MYIAKCTNYPFCNSLEGNLKELIAPKKLNRMYTYNFPELLDEEAISSEKTIIIVECVDDDNNNSGYCDLEVSFTTLSDEIELIENDSFGQLVLKNDIGIYKIGLEEYSNINTVDIDIMILSGDINFSLKSRTAELYYNKYYLSNKIYFQIPMEDNNEISEIIIEYKTTLNSYFTIKWNANRKSNSAIQYRDYITSGYSYLVEIDPTSSPAKKTIKLQNLRYKDNNPFLANFFTLNCQFKVTREQQEIYFYGGYAQEVLTSNSNKYKSDYYDYVIEIIEPDLSDYNNKMCMLYVAGMETNTSTVESQIVISDNINQQVIFEKDFNTVRFLYPNPDLTKDLALMVNVIDIGIYKVVVYSESKLVKSYTLSTTKIFYLSSSEYGKFCNANNICSITIEVSLIYVSTDTSPMIEITLRPILSIPTYLQKGRVKKDFVYGEKYYYLYTEIGKNDEGYILVNFMRGNGLVYAKIVRKDQTNIDEEANWRDKYRMPSEEWSDSIAYNPYLKKIEVKTEDTGDCIQGCYLLVSIQLNIGRDYVEDYKFFPFTILARITPVNKAYTDIPKVVIQINQYIIGNVDVSTNERIYEFYEIWLSKDSDQVEFDFQSKVAGLYINLGGTRPTTKNADFKLLPNGSHSILSLNKGEILDKAQSKDINIPYPGKIKNINLVIGVWTNKTDSVGTELYSLRVHQSLSYQINIIEVNSNQKILCRPEMIADSKYRCLFMIVYDELQEIKHIIAYGASNNKNAENYMYARFIERGIYDELNLVQLNINVPTFENAEFNSKKNGVDYIYTSKINTTKYLYISVVTDKQEDLMFVSSLETYDYQISPNPNSAQIFTVEKGQNITLKFEASQYVIVNIICLGGQAQLHWMGQSDKNAVYNLNGGERLITTSEKDVSDKNFAYLVIQESNSNDKLMTMEDPGCVFYTFFHLRKQDVNFDEVDDGQSLIAYKNTDLPIYLYNRIKNSKSNINIDLKFIDYSGNDEGQLSFKTSPFKLNAALIKEDTAYKVKTYPELKPSNIKSMISGVFDYSVNTAQISLSTTNLSNFNILNEDNPILYFELDKVNQNFSVYKQFNVEVSVSKVNDTISPLVGKYHYGKVIEITDKNNYRIKIDDSKKLIRVQVSLNSNALNFAITDSEISIKNITFLEAKRLNGKSIITLDVPNIKYIYLTFFINDKNLAKDRRLNNYCFKYSYGDTINDFKEYKIKDDKTYVSFTEKNIKNNVTDITAIFNRIEVSEGVNVTYFLKVVPNDTHVYKESYDTIAVTESPYVVASVKNPTVQSNDRIELSINNVTLYWVYLEVIAAIKDRDNWEYVCYYAQYNLRPYTPSYSSATYTNQFIFITVGVLLLFVIRLIALVIIIKIRNKKLLNKDIDFSVKLINNVEPNSLLPKRQNQKGALQGTPPVDL